MRLSKGLYKVEEKMPCNPQDIKIDYYIFPSTLKRVEQEEAAARILSFSQKMGCWVGVSWSCLLEMMQEESRALLEAQEAQVHNWKEERRIARLMKGWWVLCFLTLGTCKLFVKRPMAQFRQVETNKIVFSTVYIMGPQAVARGIYELLDQGMLKVVPGSESSDLGVFFPTPLLVSTIMQKQGVTTV